MRILATALHLTGLSLIAVGCEAFPSYPEYPGPDTASAAETGDSSWDYTYDDYEYDYSYDYGDYYDYDYSDYYSDYYPEEPGDTAVMAVGLFLDGTIRAEGELYVMDALWGIEGYGVSDGAVDWERHFCSWYAFNGSPAVPVDCPQCTFAFYVNLDFAGETGEDCDALTQAIGPYGFTGPEGFLQELELGFVPTGVAADDYGEYEYGYLSFYIGYPYYYWYNALSYSATLRPDPKDDALHLDALNGYYGIVWTP